MVTKGTLEGLETQNLAEVCSGEVFMVPGLMHGDCCFQAFKCADDMNITLADGGKILEETLKKLGDSTQVVVLLGLED